MNLRAAGPGWLFCPADRPERFAKAAAAADVVILDLEDGVAEAQKPAARNALRDTPLDPERTVVRINAGGTADQARDLEALAGTAYTTVMLPKAESAAQVISLRRVMSSRWWRPRAVPCAPPKSPRPIPPWE